MPVRFFLFFLFSLKNLENNKEAYTHHQGERTRPGSGRVQETISPGSDRCPSSTCRACPDRA